MQKGPIRILLIEDDLGDVRLIEKILEKERRTRTTLESTDRLWKGLALISEYPFDVILLDLTLPDSQGINTLLEALAKTSNIPIVVLTGISDERLAVEAVQLGAQDYLVKGQVDGPVLVRSIRYAIHRQETLSAQHSMLITDELTGLYNRRGFMTLAEHQIKIADRKKKGFMLLFADFDDLKRVNDSLGHNKGNQALTEVAEALINTFRESDVVGRIGGDEFAVLAIGAQFDHGEIMVTRLMQNLQTRNAQPGKPYTLSLSVGIAYYDPDVPCSIDELLAHADEYMYRHKKSKNETHPPDPS
ncbi:diguanylate cyclase response regulator [bacterium]|nr:diguanylate cyclase response regulator [bacterium]